MIKRHSTTRSFRKGIGFAHFDCACVGKVYFLERRTSSAPIFITASHCKRNVSGDGVIVGGSVVILNTIPIIAVDVNKSVLGDANVVEAVVVNLSHLREFVEPVMTSAVLARPAVMGFVKVSTRMSHIVGRVVCDVKAVKGVVDTSVSMS